MFTRVPSLVNINIYIFFFSYSILFSSFLLPPEMTIQTFLVCVRIGALAKSVVDGINKFPKVELHMYLTMHHDLKLHNTYRVTNFRYETTNGQSDV